MKRILINKLPSFRCHNLVIPDRVWNSGYNTPWDVYLSQASHGAVRQTTRVWHDQRKLAKNIGETQRIWRVKIYLRYNYVLRQTLNSSSLLIIDSLVTPNFHWGIIFLAFGYWLYILMCEYLSLLSYVTSSFFLSFFVGLSGDGDLDLRFSPLGKYGREEPFAISMNLFFELWHGSRSHRWQSLVQYTYSPLCSQAISFPCVYYVQEYGRLVWSLFWQNIIVIK